LVPAQGFSAAFCCASGIPGPRLAYRISGDEIERGGPRYRDELSRERQAEKFVAVQRVVATAIVTAWKMGERRRLRLADIAITAVERKTQPSPDQKLG
jgi:hypothetical protein